jgi:hypothetical protein
MKENKCKDCKMIQVISSCEMCVDIDNNPSPLEALERLSNINLDIVLDELGYALADKISPYGIHDYPSLEMSGDIKTIKQALTNYANMVEMLEGLVAKYDRIHKSFGYPRYAEVNPSEIVKDITKVLEGKNNERDMEKG